MPVRGDVFGRGGIYHVFNRGVNGGRIFFNKENYLYCWRLSERYAEKYSVKLFAVCLMPNHYHFLLEQESEIPVSKFVNVLFNAYTQAVNHRQNRKGTLFEGRFKQVLVEDDSYWLQLCRYIHLNPVKAGLVQSPGDWPYSDYLKWVDCSQKKYQMPDWIGGFSSGEEYRKFVTDGQEKMQMDRILERYCLDC